MLSMIKILKVLSYKLTLALVLLCTTDTTWFSFDVTERPRVTDEPGKLPALYIIKNSFPICCLSCEVLQYEHQIANELTCKTNKTFFLAQYSLCKPYQIYILASTHP